MYFTYPLMFENCFISIIIYSHIYIIPLKCGIQLQLQHTGSLISESVLNIWKKEKNCNKK
jgi:hypothetical protein